MFELNFISWFAGLPKEIAVVLISMVPIAELRAGLPLALTVYKLPAWEALLLSVFGNMLPIFFILKFIGPISDWLSKHSKFFAGFFTWLFSRTRTKIVRDYEKYGLWALAIFVAIPLPMTGAWTGALAAWLFGVEYKKGLFSIFCGVLGAGIIVLAITSGVAGFLRWLI